MIHGDTPLHLYDNPNEQKMPNRKPIFYSVKELFEKYPTIQERGWTIEDLESWVDQDIIIGRYSVQDDTVLEIEKESIESFIEYHNHHLKKRAERVEKGIKRIE